MKAVCEAIVAEYKQEVFNFPTTLEGWCQIANRFGARWNFHHACSALDGKHIAIRAPKNSGTVYHNYKGFLIHHITGTCGWRLQIPLGQHQ